MPTDAPGSVEPNWTAVAAKASETPTAPPVDEWAPPPRLTHFPSAGSGGRLSLYKVTMATSTTSHIDPFKHWIKENIDMTRSPVYEDLHDEGTRCRLVQETPCSVAASAADVARGSGGTIFGSTAASAAGVAEVACGSAAASAAGVAEVYDGSGSVAATAADVADLSDFEVLDEERSIVSSYPMGIKSKLLNWQTMQLNNA